MSIAVIGIGGAGGNIADEAERSGFLAGGINFSQKDLDAINVKAKLRLSGSEGVGKNRDKAIQLIQEQWEIPCNFIKDNFEHADVIAIAFSSSGGSGSGISPILLDILSNTFPEKTFIALVIIPDYSEVTVNQLNCLNTFKELSKLDIAVFPIDNEQIKIMNPNIGKNKLYELSNKKTIELLSKVNSYTEKHSKDGNFDKNDLSTVLKTKGIGMIAETDLVSSTQVNLSIDEISEKIQKSWNKSVFTPIEIEKVTRSAMIFDGQDELMQYIDYQKVFQPFQNGMPIDLFEGNYHEHNGKFISILTGLAWCNTRLQDIEKSLESNAERIGNVVNSQSDYAPTLSNVFGQLRGKPEVKKSSVADIFKKYNR